MEKIGLSVREISEMYGISQRTIWRMASNGSFPKPISIGRRKVWLLQDLNSWQKQQKRKAV